MIFEDSDGFDAADYIMLGMATIVLVVISPLAIPLYLIGRLVARLTCIKSRL